MMVATASRSKQRRRSAGFTLVELLVALTVLAFLGSGTAAVVINTLGQEQRLKAEAEAQQQLVMALSLIQSDLEQLGAGHIRDSFGDDLGARLQIREDGFERLQFARLGRRSFGAPGTDSEWLRVRYRVEDERLLRETAAVLNPDRSTNWQTQELLSDVDSLRFWVHNGQQWHPRWPAQNQSGAAKMLRVELDTKRYPDIELLVLLAGGRS